MKHIINSAPIVMHRESRLVDAVKIMAGSRSEYVLITDDHHSIVGMLTSDDVLRNLALDGFGRSQRVLLRDLALTPVDFAVYSSFVEDVKRIHGETGVKYFPILHKRKPTTSGHIVGVLSLVDIGADSLMRSVQGEGETA